MHILNAKEFYPSFQTAIMEDKSRKCPEPNCNFVTEKQHSLFEHRRVVHGDQTVVCFKCPDYKEFKTAANLQRHMTSKHWDVSPDSVSARLCYYYAVNSQRYRQMAKSVAPPFDADAMVAQERIKNWADQCTDPRAAHLIQQAESDWLLAAAQRRESKPKRVKTPFDTSPSQEDLIIRDVSLGQKEGNVVVEWFVKGVFAIKVKSSAYR